MNKIEVKHLGRIDLSNIAEEQEYMEINFQGRELLLLWFAEKFIDKDFASNAKQTLKDLEKFDQENKLFLKRVFNNDKESIIHEYLELHINELSEDFADYIDQDKSKEENVKHLFNQLQLATISFYNDVIVADYVLNQEYSDQILAISFKNNNSRELAWES